MEKTIMMEDMELQALCHKAGIEYCDLMYTGITDLEKKHVIINAAAAGYSKGFRDGQEAMNKESISYLAGKKDGLKMANDMMRESQKEVMGAEQ